MKNHHLHRLVLWLWIGALFLTPEVVCAQEEEKESKHHVGLLGGLTYIPSGQQNPDDDFVIAPTVGVEYLYEFHPRWLVAAMVDIELIEYGVESHAGLINRENPLILAATAMFRVTHKWIVYAGPGYEIETHETFFVFRTGIKYEIHSGHFEYAPTLEFDFKEDTYASIFLGLAIGRAF